MFKRGYLTHSAVGLCGKGSIFLQKTSGVIDLNILNILKYFLESLLDKTHDCNNEKSDQIWSNGCHQCFCKDGHEYCSLISCKKLECSNPVHLKNSCCPSCPGKSKIINYYC